LVDVTMPVMDGLELLERLRADPRFAALPVIVMTAARDEAAAALGEHVVTKPVNPDELLALLQARLRTH
ncbi:MAG: response regulator, partial [Myxococcales bacterium]